MNHIKFKLIVFLFFLIIINNINAATFTVSNVNELQNILNITTANEESDTINILPGDYNITNTLEYLPNVTPPEIYHLFICGDSTGATNIDGGNTNQILTINTNVIGYDSSADITIKQVNFKNGNSSGHGGALCVNTNYADIEIQNSSFYNNYNSLYGGGISLSSGKGKILLSDNTFSNNEAGDDGGGAEIWSDEGEIVLINNIFLNNSTETGDDGGGASICTNKGQIKVLENTFESNNGGDDGGGVFTYPLESEGSILISDNLFLNNTAYLGGAGSYSRCNSGASILICNNTFIDNYTSTWRGGGSYVYSNSGDIVIEDNTYENNFSAENGGGVWCWGGEGNIDIHYNFFNDNYAENNGAGIDASTDNGILSIKGNVVSNNTANNIGAGMSIATITGNLSIKNNTIYKNQANNGGGIYFYVAQTSSIINVVNNILWNNQNNEISSAGSGNIMATYSDIKDGFGEPWFGVGCIDSNPLFADSSNNDFRLTWLNFPINDSTKSPCIDAGNPLAILDPDSTIADIGAYYFDQSKPSKPENITIYLYADSVIIEWEEVVNADFYRIYSSDNPYNSFNEDTTGVFNGNTWKTNLSTTKLFFYVVSVKEDSL